jgi:glycosyltransferase involved in cell wall biosynthesis
MDGRAFMSPAAGVRRYVSELYRAISEIAPDLRVDALGADSRTTLPSCCRAVTEWPSPPTNLGRHAVGVPVTLWRRGYDVYHAPAYVGPLWGSVSSVVSIHDVSYERRPEWYPYKRDAFRRLFYRQAARRAAAILVPSQFTARELVAAYDVPDDLVHVVPLAAGPAFYHHTLPVRPEGGEVRYLLHVGDLHARRDLQTAVAALAELTSRSPQWRLVLIGHDRGVWSGIQEAARRLQVAGAIQWIPSVTEDDLLRWYQRAFCLLYPSRYEGFGFPLVEAMAAGLPVVAADASCTPEVVGAAGLRFAPGDGGEAASCVTSLLEVDGLWERQQAAGRLGAARFSWKRTATATLGVLGAVAERG